VLLRYATGRLQLVDAEGNPAATAEPGTDLPMVLRNQADVLSGAVSFSAGRLTGRGAPAGRLVVARLYFRVLQPLPSNALPVALDYVSGDAPTGAFYRGRPLALQEESLGQR